MVKQSFTVSITTRNDVGLIVRLAGMFLRRHIAIQNMNLTTSVEEQQYHFILEVDEEEEVLKKLLLQIEKQVDVFEASYYKHQNFGEEKQLLIDPCHRNVGVH